MATAARAAVGSSSSEGEPKTGALAQRTVRHRHHRETNAAVSAKDAKIPAPTLPLPSGDKGLAMTVAAGSNATGLPPASAMPLPVRTVPPPPSPALAAAQMREFQRAQSASLQPMGSKPANQQATAAFNGRRNLSDAVNGIAAHQPPPPPAPGFASPPPSPAPVYGLASSDRPPLQPQSNGVHYNGAIGHGSANGTGPPPPPPLPMAAPITSMPQAGNAVAPRTAPPMPMPDFSSLPPGVAASLARLAGVRSPGEIRREEPSSTSVGSAGEMPPPIKISGT